MIIRGKQSPLLLQNEFYHQHLMYHWSLVQRYMPEFGVREIPLVATMPTLSLNAQTWKSPHQDGYAIVFNEALLTFLFLLSKVVARYFPGDLVTNRSQPEKGTLSVLFDREHINKVVLRCLEWVETTSGWQREIEFAGDQIDHGLQVAG